MNASVAQDQPAPEAVIDPARPIVDCHHHLWDVTTQHRPKIRYLLHEFLADSSSGHNVVATVYIECNSMYRSEGPVHLRSLGETEFAAGMAAMSASGGYGNTRVCAGIVGFVDLTGGSKVGETLDAHILAAGGRFRGIRHGAAWDADESVRPGPMRPPRGLLADAKFRAGFAELAARGLAFDAWVFPAQLPEVADLARAFPQTPIIINHVGSPRGTGSYAGKQKEMLQLMRDGIATLVEHQNVCVKLGGLGAWSFGLPFYERTPPATSQELADAWRPYVQPWLDAFGPSRAMFESNFPPDRPTGSYVTIWNAFKRLAAGYSEGEKNDLFARTAARFYRLPLAVENGQQSAANESSMSAAV